MCIRISEKLCLQERFDVVEHSVLAHIDISNWWLSLGSTCRLLQGTKTPTKKFSSIPPFVSLEPPCGELLTDSWLRSPRLGNY